MATLLTTSYKLIASVKTSDYSILRLYAKYNSQDVETNKSNISLQARLYGNGGGGSFDSGTITIAGTSYSLGKTSYTKGSETTLKTKTYDVSHDDDGTLDLSVSAKITSSYAVSGTCTGSITLPTIPRATTPTLELDTYELGTTITVNLPRASENFTHDLYYKVGNSATMRFAEAVETSYDWSQTLGLANWITDDEKGVVTIYCETYNGTTLVGAKSITFTGTVPENIVPEIDSITISEAVNGIADKIGAYVKNKSRLNVVVEASGRYACKIKSYKTTIDNVTYINSSFTSDVLTTSGTIEATISVTDTRGRITTQIVELEVLDYYTPKIVGFGVDRCTSDGTLADDDTATYLKFYINYDIAPLNNKNDKKVAFEYYDTSNNSWVELINYTDLYTNRITYIPTTQFDVDKSYECRVVITDYFATGDNASAFERVVTPTYTLLNFHKDGKAMGFGKLATREKGFQFGDYLYDEWDTIITNGVAVAGGDPDTTLETLIMTSTNSPTGLAMYFYTFFNSNKYEGTNRSQIAVPYLGSGDMYYRWKFNGEWTDWKRLANANEIGDLANLETTSQNNLVSAINEVNTKNIITARLTSNYAITTANTYETLPLEEWKKIGDKLSVNDNGEVVIGEGVNFIKVNGNARMNNGSNGAKYLTIQNSNNQQLLQTINMRDQTGSTPLSLSPSIFPVTKGEKIKLRVYGAANDTIAGANQEYGMLVTYLTVEVVG